MGDGESGSKVVLVAGGTGGLGRAVSLAFVEAGARVIVTFQRPGDLDELKKAASAKLVKVEGASLEGYAVDVTDEMAAGKLIDGIVERHGRLDCLGERRRRICGRCEIVGDGVESIRTAVDAEFARRICIGASCGAGDGKARERGDCERGVESGGGPRCGSIGVCGVEGGGRGHDRLPGGGFERDGSARKLDFAEHY